MYMDVQRKSEQGAVPVLKLEVLSRKKLGTFNKFRRVLKSTYFRRKCTENSKVRRGELFTFEACARHLAKWCRQLARILVL